MTIEQMNEFLIDMGMTPNGKYIKTIGNKSLIMDGENNLLLTLITPSQSIWNTSSGGSFTSKWSWLTNQCMTSSLIGYLLQCRYRSQSWWNLRNVLRIKSCITSFGIQWSVQSGTTTEPMEIKMTKQITNILYQLTPKLKTLKPDQTIKDSPYLPILQTLGQLSLSYEGEPSNKMKKMIGNLTGLLKMLSNGTEPKYLTPKELISQLPTLTISQLSSEILWLTNLYYWFNVLFNLSLFYWWRWMGFYQGLWHLLRMWWMVRSLLWYLRQLNCWDCSDFTVYRS